MTRPTAQPADLRTLDVLDDALVAVRRVMLRPAYRRRLMAVLEQPLELGALRTLRAVERHAGDAPCVGEIAEALAVDPSTASRTVDRCVDAGLLTRTPSAHDRRRTSLALTAEGRAVLDRVNEARRDLLAEVTADWDAADIDRLAALLADLLDGFDRFEASS